MEAGALAGALRGWAEGAAGPPGALALPEAELRARLAGRLPGRAAAELGGALAAAAAALAPAAEGLGGAGAGETPDGEAPPAAGGGDAAQRHALLGLGGLARAALVALWEGAGGPALWARPLLPVAMALSEVLLPAAAVGGEAGSAFAEAAARLGEQWWALRLPGRERLVAHVPYLLMRALLVARPADVKRLLGTREALECMGWDDDAAGGTGDVKRLLLRCAFAPAFLRAEPGRRFLGWVFCLHPALTEELAAIVRNQVPAGRPSVLRAYGEVLFRAWRDPKSAGACLEKVEEVVGDLAQAALLARSPALAASLRGVLGGFHLQKRQRGVDDFLAALHGPRLFRGLCAANPAVRVNSLRLLVDCFPLCREEPAASAGRMAREEVALESQELVDRQLAGVSKLLYDECPAVRAAACEAAGALLGTFWEIVPARSTIAWLKALTSDLAHDAAAATVREAAVAALARLVDHPLASGSLGACLPRLGPLIRDSQRRVRLALCGLLLGVRHIRQLPFYEIVPVDDLFEALATDEKAVALRVAKLLVPSYVDAAAEPEVNASQLVALTTYRPDAGPRVCRLALEAGADVTSVEGMVAALFKAMYVAAAEASEGAAAKRKRGDDGAAPDFEPDELAAAPEECDGDSAFEAMAVCCQELCAALQAGGHSTYLVLQSLGATPDKVLSVIVAGAASEAARKAVLSICMHLPASSCESIVEECRRSVRSRSGAFAGAVFADRDLVACMSSWGKAQEVLARARRSLVAYSTGESPEEGAPGLPEALSHVNAIMAQGGVREKILEHERVETLLPILGQVLLKALHALEEGPVESEAVDMASVALLTYGKCAVHVHLFSIAGGEAVTASAAIFEGIRKCLGAISSEEHMRAFAPVAQCAMALTADAARLGLFEDDAAIAGLAKACATSLRENFQRVAAPVPAPLTLHVQKLESLLEPAPTPA